MTSFYVIKIICCIFNGGPLWSLVITCVYLRTISAVISNIYTEEQPVATSPYKSRIWKRNVHDTFTILFRGFLHHLNNQKSSIRFTMETESDSKLVFVDTAVSRKQYCRHTTSVYRKPTHSDQYNVPSV